MFLLICLFFNVDVASVCFFVFGFWLIDLCDLYICLKTFEIDSGCPRRNRIALWVRYSVKELFKLFLIPHSGRQTAALIFVTQYAMSLKFDDWMILS